ncbi:hypothetical protein [Trichlorobacter lovleyi]|uniref:hypothetical protein n=1 Tax=Trichlorobacter lovleyi TaxID=313985 RepID=UPI00223EB27B|nr:hypothetical protein [Trichlorobacter lovleyi]
MRISLHWYEFTIKHLTEDALKELCTLLDIQLSVFNLQITKTGEIYRYAVPHSGVAESLYIKNPSNRESYGVVKIKGSYWEQNPDLPFDLLHKFAKKHQGNTKRIDVAFDDDKGKLPFREIIRVSHKDLYKQNIVGTHCCPIVFKAAPVEDLAMLSLV